MAQVAVTRVTHSCHLIEIGGRRFLTDPWFSTRPGYYQGEPIAIGITESAGFAAAAFAAHLTTDQVHEFIASIPSLSTGGPDSLIQLAEVATS